MSDALPDCMMPDGADPCEGYQQLQRELASKEKECAELRKDANRYRWLCDAPGKWWLEDGGFEAHMAGRLGEAIDAAMK